MIGLFTSNPMIPGTEKLNPANGLVDSLRLHLPAPCGAVFVCSDPDAPEKTDSYAASTRLAFAEYGFHFQPYTVLDRRNAREAKRLIRGAGLVILAGGHVPTQNRFFAEIGLGQLLAGYEGVVMGVSAGTMNSAKVVYAQPEMPGEAVDPHYRRFLTGLNLTDVMVLPHYQLVQGAFLDGLRLFEDITFPDSRGHTFYALPDGSYLYAGPEGQEIRGEAYRIRDGAMALCCRAGEVLPLP